MVLNNCFEAVLFIGKLEIVMCLLAVCDLCTVVLTVLVI